MLFDLRGRGRRRTVQGIYLGLALLMGIGLVGFGIGGGFGGTGIFNALTNQGGSSSASFSADIAKDRKAIAVNPQNVSAYGALVADLYRQAGSGNNYNQTLGEFTTAAHSTLQQVSTAWQQYLAVNPNHPDPALAAYMVQVYGPNNNALNQPSKALQAEQIVVNNKTSPGFADYEALALFAFAAHNTRQGDLAAARAIDLAPSAQQAQLRAQLKAIKANPSLLTQAASQPQATGPQTFSVPSSAAGASTAAPSGTTK